ncbi:efflux RND transporter periplasmic adaptor subunit [Mesorhizobium muleiense]|uniref:RND family efflux transporter, MFP subunit n=1 Tax=Mesorhizobium muleiense TaxID=1004279 RepID=A0A1G8LIR3_9HYPH|nr:efflux RND transporter periplasmic adaptor subunit [Mesorhizobium muleiense]MCF6100324.1 efflux RND transporter periplasmic adaptor subunit [Mesorhizobium muleiense]SDI55100.1 RND family efflux transporter, MFP subunit [Mesorhizobium muleiense]
MNTITEHDRKLAAALTSLSLGSAPDTVETQKKDLRLLILPVCLSALAALVVATVAFYSPEAYRRFEDRVLTTTGLTGSAADNAVIAPVEQASLPQVEKQAGQSAVRPPVPAAGEITGSGTVIAPRATMVFSKYEGRITNIAIELGDFVDAGQALVILDDAGARFALERARAAKVAADLLLTARTIDLDQARSALGRTATLATRDAVSKQQLEEARRAAESVENAVAQARQELATAELAIRIAEEPVRELTVRAPFAGTVTRLDAHIGDTVLARVDSVRESQSLLTIADTTNMVIDADVAETSIASLRPGLRGEAVLDGFPDRPFAVEVLRLAPIASIEKGTITLRLSLSNPPEGIRPNMAARIRIPLIDTLSNTGDTKQ